MKTMSTTADFNAVGFDGLVDAICSAMTCDVMWKECEQAVRRRVRKETGRLNDRQFPFVSGGVKGRERLVAEMLITQLRDVKEHVIPVETLNRIKMMKCPDCRRDAVARLIVAPMCQIIKAEDRVIPRLDGEDFDFPFSRYGADEPIKFKKIRGEEDLVIFPHDETTADSVSVKCYMWSNWITHLGKRNGDAANMWKVHESKCDQRDEHFAALKKKPTPGQGLAYVYAHIEKWINDNDPSNRLCLLGGRNRLTVEALVRPGNTWMSLYRFCVNAADEVFFLNVPEGREWHLACGTDELAAVVESAMKQCAKAKLRATWRLDIGTDPWAKRRAELSQLGQLGFNEKKPATDVRTKVGVGVRLPDGRRASRDKLLRLVEIILNAMLRAKGGANNRGPTCFPNPIGYDAQCVCAHCVNGWARDPLTSRGARRGVPPMP